MALLLEDLTAKEGYVATKPKRKPWRRKTRAVAIIVDEQGKIVRIAGYPDIDVAVIPLNTKKPVPIGTMANYLLFDKPEVIKGVHYVEKKRRKGKKKRAWVEVPQMVCSLLGISFIAHSPPPSAGYGTPPHRRLVFPPTVLPSRNKYSADEEVLMNELLMQGAVWCDFCGRHFLAVLTPEMRSMIPNKINPRTTN